MHGAPLGSKGIPRLCVNDMVPIGGAYPGLTAVLVDQDLGLVPQGESGELCLCGPQTSPGYWKDPARTAERFVKIPAAGTDGGNLLPNGRLGSPTS